MQVLANPSAIQTTHTINQFGISTLQIGIPIIIKNNAIYIRIDGNSDHFRKGAFQCLRT